MHSTRSSGNDDARPGEIGGGGRNGPAGACGDPVARAEAEAGGGGRTDPAGGCERAMKKRGPRWIASHGGRRYGLEEAW